jgi:hypothetical protein
MRHIYELNHRVYKTSTTGHHHKEDANPSIHDGQIVQWLTNGHIAVIGHHHQKEHLNTTN